MKTTPLLSLILALAVALAFADDQTSEAAAVFGGGPRSVAADPLSSCGGTWKVVYSSAEGPEGRALEVLTERLGPHLLREPRTSTAHVLPLEKANRDGRDGARPSRVAKRDAIIIGVPAENPVLAKCLKGTKVPKGGYFIRTLHDAGHNLVLIAGDGPAEVLWGVFDFLDVVAPDIEARFKGAAGRYAGEFFFLDKIPAFTRATSPETPTRSIFSWGHVVDDCRTTFRALARARFNRAILWVDQPVVNARDVVATAHSWGVKVFWGFSWGWTMSGTDGRVDVPALAERIVDEWRRQWRPMGGDGIYFQSFTETDKELIGGRPIAEVVVELVNRVSARIHAEAPATEIVFGLHSNSMRKKAAAEALAKTDPALEILWENCGGFPFWEANGKSPSTNDFAFVDRILALTPRVGLVWKAQLRMDWPHYASPAGPFMLGVAGERLLRRDQAVLAPLMAASDEEWLAFGLCAHALMRHVRAGGHPPREMNAVAEYNPPFGFATHCQAELFWSSADSWDEIARRARRRARPER